MSLRDKIVELITETGIGFVEKSRTIKTTCPSCHQDDKFSILKENGSCICYRGSCDFGRQWFQDWLALTLKISVKEARAKISNEKKSRVIDPGLENGLKLDFVLKNPNSSDDDPLEAALSKIKPFPFPEFYMVPIDDPSASEGAAYLASRGVSMELAKKYGVHYAKIARRVYFPVVMNGTPYGYQGRHIDKVPEDMRMRNNDGFARETLVMFADNLIGKTFAIMAEGPFDALKFDSVGANVCTMGKVVTDKQLEIIRSYGITKLYLALDDDAASEMNAIVDKGQLELYKIDVPQSCIDRCAAAGKKADFGECTFEEAEVAFRNARRLGLSRLLLHLK